MLPLHYSALSGARGRLRAGVFPVRSWVLSLSYTGLLCGAPSNAPYGVALRRPSTTPRLPSGVVEWQASRDSNPDLAVNSRP